MRSAGVVFLIVAMLSLNGCWFRKSKPQAQTPPPPVQAPRAVQTQPTAPVRKQPVKRKSSSAPAPRAAQPSAIPPKAAAGTPGADEQLGRILTADERSRYKAMYERSSSAARKMLETLSATDVAAGKREAIGRIRSFLAQAQEAASSDWTAAAQLAHRAEVLARDLMRLLQ